MANLITVRLNKGDSPSWGFRLQGGKDFGAPLVIQKVNVGSPAERAGLIAGDSVIRVNNTDVFNLRHKDAQDVIVRAGPSFDVSIQRGGSTWKPAVIPTGSLSSPKPHVPASNISPVTQTSLAAPKSDSWGSVGTGHNVSAKPFGGGAVNGLGPKLVNKQYNSPVNLYSEDTIAETLSAQAEVLANGVLGVNFKKNEKTYDASKSNVLRYVKEDELGPKSPEPAHDSLDAGVVTTPSQLGIAGLRPVRAPENKPAPSNPNLPPGQNICAECERLIVGVFVRIKEKNLHVECFKCSTCGTSLKNVGYYNINNKLYCDVHAKLAARNNPPGSNLAPVTIPPIGRPIGGVSSLSPNSLPSSAPLSPNINSYAPPPFQTHDPHSGYVCVRSNAPGLIKTSLNSAASRKRTVTNDVFNPVKTNPLPPTTTTYVPNCTKTNVRSGPNISAPRPFSSGPLSPSGNSYSTLPKVSSIPLSSDRNTSLNVVWPPLPPEESEVPTACPIYLPPPSHVKVKTIANYCPKQTSKEHSTEKCKIEKTQTQEETITQEESTTQEVSNLNAANLSKLNECFEQDIMSYVTSDIGQYSSLYSDTSSISGRKSTQECVEILNDVIDNQRLVENLRRTRPLFVETDDSILSQEQPMWEAKSVLKEGSCMPITNTRTEKVSSHLSAKSEMANTTSSSEIQTSTKQEKKETVSTTSHESPSTCSIKLNRYTKKVENATPHEYESPMVLALTVASDRPFSQMQVEITKSEHTKLDDVTQEVMTTEEVTSSSSAQHSTQLQQVTSSQIEQKLQQTAQQQSFQIEEEKSISRSAFEEIPGKISSSAFANALVTAPSEPFGICQTPTEPVPLPEETSPYFPPSDLFAVKISSKSEEEIKKSEKLSRFRKKKDELDDIFKDLPKPTQRIDLLSALTTAPDRPFSPIPAKLEEEAEVIETTDTLENEITQKEINAVDKSRELLKPSAPKCFKSAKSSGSEFLSSITEETKARTGKNIEHVSTHKRTSQKATECKSKAVECKSKAVECKSKAVECKSQMSSKSKIGDCRQTECNKCSLSEKQQECCGVQSIYFKDQKIDYSTKIENDEKRTQPIKEEISKIVQDNKSIVATEKDKISKCSKIPKPNQEIKASEYKEVRVSSETQVSAASASQIHEERHVSRISSQATSQIPTKIPVTAINHGEYQQKSIPGTVFQPVLDEKPFNKSFSPRPRSITPSMINKAPPLIPAYQAMLVPMECLPAPTNVFDPTSPCSSRAPSPCPGRASASSGRASPFPSKTSVRSMSPAVGPPRNPLEIINPKPQPSPRVVEARTNIATTYQKSSEDRAKQVKAAKYALEKVSSDVAASQCAYQSETGDRVLSQTCTAQRDREQQLQEQMQAQEESVEVTRDKNVQIQRKKKVVEEYEHSQKSKTLEIAKSTLTTKSRVVGGDCQVAVSGMHVTNPRPLRNPFQKKSITELPKKSINGGVDDIPREETKIDTLSRNGSRDSCQNKSCTFAASNIPKLVKTKSFPTSGSSPKPFIPPPPCDNVTKPFVSQPNVGSGSGRQVGAIGFSPKRGRGVLNLGGGSRVPLCGHCHAHIRSDINTQTNQNNELERERSFENDKDEVEDKLKKFSEITITIPHQKSNEPFSLESTSPGSNCSSLSSGNINYHKQTASESSDSGKPESLHDGDLHYGPRISSSEDVHSSMELSLGNSNAVSENDNCSNTSLIMLDHAYPNNEEKVCLSQLSLLLKEKAKTYREMTSSSDKQNFTYKHFANAEESNSLYPEEVLTTSVPICNQCNKKITRGPFVTALGKIWCPEHFSCATPSCKRPLQDLGFVEEQGQLYCEYCFERYLAPNCSKCGVKVKAECLKAIGKHFHPECFNCVHCGKLFGNNPFFLEDGQPYCDNDWNELFTTKCFACGFPIEAGDRWVEALNNNYHSQCFNCTMCKKNLEGQSFFAKGGRPFCKNHAR